MKIVMSEGVYKASQITGPRHNFLGLAVTLAPPAEVLVVQRHLQEKQGVSQIDEAKLRAAVSEGVLSANRELGASLFVDRIEYVPTDTPDYSAYVDLAKAIVRFAHGDLERGRSSYATDR